MHSPEKSSSSECDVTQEQKNEVLFYRVSWDTYDDFAYRVKCERIKNHYMKVVHALLWSMSWFPGYMH